MPDSHVHPDTRKKPSKAEERLAEVVKRLRKLEWRIAEDDHRVTRLELRLLADFAEHGE